MEHRVRETVPAAAFPQAEARIRGHLPGSHGATPRLCRPRRCRRTAERRSEPFRRIPGRRWRARNPEPRFVVQPAQVDGSWSRFLLCGTGMTRAWVSARRAFGADETRAPAPSRCPCTRKSSVGPRHGDVEVAQAARHGAGDARPDRTAVDGDHRHHEGRGAGVERLRRGVGLLDGEQPLLHP